ncbi:tripartite tricarboxylate transporter substrate binding protein [Nesterenkonia sp. HG001]|uniref:tripartite tricarboxylate transporter substrate binding protein n=1 Tax=Nesterenkonia sp. HG001 TaxID=2983207 RepID=UPI002AC45924|nr:tripartite tricarboxylate transporter substrate binding protein [Nesterenkonia sp. HG001]MDZ5077177.1 tripartite tricarboxylate transporter substrate binding protein [Nesterenkonia sp. HG001]
MTPADTPGGRSAPRARPARRLVASMTALGLASALAACGGVTDGGGDSEGFPQEPVRMTVGYDAGGPADVIARALAEGSQDSFGVAMPVENQPGANGALAVKDIAGRDADGYELTLLNASLMTITPLAVSDEEAVSWDEVDVVMSLVQNDYVLIATEDSDIDTLGDMVEAEEPITYGTTGVGTGSQLAQLALFGEAGIDGTEVPFDSGPPALTAVMGGQVEVGTVHIGDAMPQILAGTVKPILIFSEERNEHLPDTPTAAEEGHDIPVTQYSAVGLPAGADDDVVATLQEGFQEIVQTDDWQDFLDSNYLVRAESLGDEVEQEWAELGERYAEFAEEYDIDLGGDD